LTVVLWELDGADPVTVMDEVPTGVDADVVTVIVELAPALIAAGLKAAWAPVAVRLIDSAEPEVTAVLMVLVALWPWVTVSAAGDAEMLKSLVTVPFTVSVTVVV